MFVIISICTGISEPQCATLLGGTESAPKGAPHDHTPSARSGAPERPPERTSASASDSRFHAPPRGGGAHDAWPEHYMRESAMHAVGVVVAVRAELMALLADLPALVRVYLVLCLPLKR